jgi:transposase-like protein
MPRSYPPEFRRRVAEVAADLGLSGACIYNWRKQDRIDNRSHYGKLFAPNVLVQRSILTTDARTSAWLATASAAKKTARAPMLSYRA